MIEIQNDFKSKSKCCGCSACVLSCPSKCIEMKYDEEGFSYPVVCNEKCIDCGICESVCPELSNKNHNNVSESEFYCAYSSDKDIVYKSSSGGIFSELAKRIIDENGVVYGVRVESDNERGKGEFWPRHARAESLSEYSDFRKSKYLQSNINGTYVLVAEDLKIGRKVLFSGTPCQIAGLYKFLEINKNICMENLYTVDLICHGVPSAAIFESYIDTLEEKKGIRPISMSWRDKKFGWSKPSISIVYMDGSKDLFVEDKVTSYQHGFLSGLYLRPSCYGCQFSVLPRYADISLGDFWRYEGELDNRDGGLSLVVVNNKKGHELFEVCKSCIMFEQVSKDLAVEKSDWLSKAPSHHPLRRRVLEDFQKNGFGYLEKHYINPNFINRVIRKIYCHLDLHRK